MGVFTVVRITGTAYLTRENHIDMENSSIQIDIDNLELSYPHYAYRLVHPTLKGNSPAEALVKDGGTQSFMTDKSIVSFVAGVNASTRADILNSLLLAQLAANKQVPDPDQVLDWYKAYIGVLSRLGGWVVEAKGSDAFKLDGTLVEVQAAIISLLTKAFGQDYIDIIKDTLDAISKLSSGDGRIEAFDKNTRGNKQGVFQMGMAVETNGAVVLQLGSFMIETSDKTTTILFVKFDKNSTLVDYFTHKATFANASYGAIRDQVVAKLGLKASQYVDEIEI
jgi:hypothetical protein